MVQLGKFNTFTVVKELDFGIYLDGGALGEILMPRRYVPEGTKPGDALEAFLYRDSEDRFIATTEKPLAQVGRFAYLKVKEVHAMGAFLDWGLPKDLLVPHREQQIPMTAGNSYVVFVFEDEASQRIVASSKIDLFLDNKVPTCQQGDEVYILVASKTPLGYKAIVNHLYWGVLYANEVFEPLQIGESRMAYIKKVRDDDKLDLSLQKAGYARVDDLQSRILEKLRAHGGFLPVSDKSDAALISELFGCSKKSFKMTIGSLFKNRVIFIEPKGITLVK